ncbi:MAG: DUF664 domain-containing protein [Chloroflexi bacterium]|nr:MAG: DUF664 domain-containing protein [Chloroflexota bacterium]
MILFAKEFMNRLHKLHEEIKETYAGLPQAALEWEPGEEMNSINVLVTHVAGAERYWIGDLVGQDSSDRVRATEFEATGLTVNALDQRLDEVLTHSEQILAQLSLDKLDLMRFSPQSNHEFSVSWCLLHALEHTAVHVGHLQIMRQLWLQQNPL